MFYSQEFLTSRKWGLATCWLVANQTEKSDLRKVARKDIVGVHVVKACSTIVNSETPLALRLQSGLLFGVSRIFHKQCSYVLADVEQAAQNIREQLRIVESAKSTTRDSHVAKRDNIILRDDPDFDWHSGLADITSGQVHDLAHGIHLPSSYDVLELPDLSPSVGSRYSASLAHDFMDFHSAASPFASDGPGLHHQQDRIAEREEPEGYLLEDPGFGFDAEGNLLDGNPDERLSMAPLPIEKALSLDETNLNVIQSIERQNVAEDGGLPLALDEEHHSDVQAFPVRRNDNRHDSSEIVRVLTQTAPDHAQRTKRTKAVLFDVGAMQLTHAELSEQVTSYTARMRAAGQRKMPSREAAVSRTNVETALQHNGIGGPYLPSIGPVIPEALAMFASSNLLALFVGMRQSTSTGSRVRTPQQAGLESLDGSVNGRRVRRHIGDANQNGGVDELGRGLADADDNGPLDIYDSMELGRIAVTPVADNRLSLSMPWNASVSGTRASSLKPSSRRGLWSGSAAGHGHVRNVRGSVVSRQLQSASRQGSSVAPASPLFDHGLPMLDDGGLGFCDLLATPAGSVEKHGSVGSGHGNTHGMDALAWQQAVLDTESINFLDFVQTHLTDHVGIGAAAEDDGSVAFHQLLPTTETKAAVAARGLLHVLNLGSKNAFRVRQDEAYGPILLSF